MTSHEPLQQRLIGYARVSTGDQELALQIDSLLKHGVKREHIFCDKLSGVKVDRPGLTRCQECLRSGDTLVVWRLDRLGCSMRHLVTMIEDLKERGIAFRSVCDGAIDTTTPSGELIFHVFSALAQFERRLIQERTKTGLAAARAWGRRGGCRPLSPKAPRVVLSQKLFRDNSISVDDICATLKISRTTLYKYVGMERIRDDRSIESCE